ncbi:MAG: DNA-processing protein DprA [Thermodesulfobacteriota bacterium]|nr:DNA-processing protein DprA [Thermodesulfobacteriota bacterium]
MDKDFWAVALSLVPGIGSVLFKKLIYHFKAAESVFKASFKELMTVEGVGIKTAHAIKNFNKEDQVQERLLTTRKKDVQVLTLENESYPSNLLKIDNPPPILYVKGKLKRDDQFAIAVVGSRNPSKYGELATGLITRDLAEKGITIVSGMARGIDTISHKEALNADGRTLAVLGSGIDVIYPPENRKLFERITQKGAVLTEFPISTPPDSVNFPHRNRIISGLTLGVVIIEAGYRSGSLITAKLATRQNRMIFAVPGQIGFDRSRGTNKLIKNGAILVENANDILNEIVPKDKLYNEASKGQSKEVKLSPNAKIVIDELSEDPVPIDSIIIRTGLSVNDVSTVLLDLELRGFVKQLPGKIFIKNL